MTRLIERINLLTVALFNAIVENAALKVENDRLAARLTAMEALATEYVGRTRWGL